MLLILSVLSNNMKIAFPPMIFRVLTRGLQSGHQFHTPLPQGFLKASHIPVVSIKAFLIFFSSFIQACPLVALSLFSVSLT